ncbi:MAG: exonuclease SbcCD subunit D [Armatimonadota bacterium]|nr:exonuclease SbcCD subunit D [Armatimonadota bacterium]
MRIVHTSDWHAGRLWRQVNRLPELATALEDLADFLERERVDVLLMSGDVFDSPLPPAEAERVVFEFFKRIGTAGVQTVVVAGNHDSPVRLQAWGTLAELVHVRAVSRPLRATDGGVLELVTRSGERAVVAAVPFAPPGAFVRALDLAGTDTQVRQRYTHHLQRIVEHLCGHFRPDAVNLLVAHAFVEGAVLSGSEREVHVGEAWAATPQALPPHAHYVALGHVHRPQRVLASPAPAEYAGSVLQLDFNEAGEEKSFVFLPDAVPGRPVRPERVPYRGGKPLLEVRGSLEDLERRAPELRERGWIRVTVPLRAPDPDIGTKVRRILPEAVVVRVELPETKHAPPASPRRHLSPLELYRLFHRARYGTEPSEALVAAFERFRERAEEVACGR